MKLELERHRMLIIPENEMEEAYLEGVYNLQDEGDMVEAKRVNAMGLSCWAYLEIKVKSVRL